MTVTTLQWRSVCYTSVVKKYFHYAILILKPNRSWYYIHVPLTKVKLENLDVKSFTVVCFSFLWKNVYKTVCIDYDNVSVNFSIINRNSVTLRPQQNIKRLSTQGQEVYAFRIGLLALELQYWQCFPENFNHLKTRSILINFLLTEYCS